MTDHESDILHAAVVKIIRQREITLNLTSPIKTSVKKGDVFRTRPLNGDEEFLLENARIGARKQVIFLLKPMDARDYEHAELNEKVFFECFPEMELEFAKQLGFENESWGFARKAFIDQELARLEAEQAAAKSAEKGRYQDNPNWGLF